jgi:hypothetical protein
MPEIERLSVLRYAPPVLEKSLTFRPRAGLPFEKRADWVAGLFNTNPPAHVCPKL